MLSAILFATILTQVASPLINSELKTKQNEKSIYTFIVSSCLNIAVTHVASAQPGSLDATFGTGGKVTTPVGSYSDYGWSTAMQSDGKNCGGGI